MSAVLDTIENLRDMSTRYESCVVALSFGKDSLVTFDLCAKYLKRVEGFCMSFVLGLDITKRWIDWARNRWSVEIKEVEHWAAVQQKAQGYRCFPVEIEGPLPTLATTIEQQKREFGVQLSVTGTRADESIGRRAGLKRLERGEKAGAWPGDFHPIAWWKRSDVVAYLRNNNLPMDDIGADMQGLSSEAASILKLHDECPEDYERWKQVFPFVDAIVARRRMYGISA